MKISILLLLSIFLMACNSIDKKAYTNAAEKTCACMKNAKEESDDGSFDKIMINFNYSMCVVDVISEEVDCSKEAFTEAITEVCPSLIDAQKKYVESVKEANL